MIPTQLSPFPNETVLAAQQGGTGLDATQAAAGYALVTTGNPQAPIGLGSPSGSPLNAVTQMFTDTSTLVATDAFAAARVELSDSTRQINMAGSGTFSGAGVGSGAQILYTAAGGAITGIDAIVVRGAGYAVGDLCADTSGNNDGVIRVLTVNGAGGILTAAITYGGTKYAAGIGVTGNLRPTNSAFAGIFNLTGLLTGNAILLLTPGNFTTQSKTWVINNNTTGAFTVKVQLSGQAGGISTDTPIGAGVVIPQGSNNSTAAIVQSDGVTDVWLANPSSASTTQILTVQEQHASGTNAATGAGGNWTQRALNTVIANTITGASLSSNAIILPAGTYNVRACGIAVNWLQSQIALYDFLGAAYLGYGTSEYVAPAASGSTLSKSVVDTVLTVAATVHLGIYHYVNVNIAGANLGTNTSTGFGAPEIYSYMTIVKL